MTEVLHYTLGELSDRNAEQWPEGEALVDLSTGERLTWREFSKQSDLLARGFLSLGFKPGHHLALWGGSSVTWVVAQYAAAKAGLIVVSADPEYDRDQISYLLEQSDAETIFVIEGYKDNNYGMIVAELCAGSDAVYPSRSDGVRFPALRNFISARGRALPGFMTMEEVLEKGAEVPVAELQQRKALVKDSDVTLISYTSGTTGAPKGVMCTHYGLVNKAHLSAGIMGLTHKDRTGLCVPLYHMFGNTCALLCGLTKGATLVMFGQYHDTERALRGLSEAGCTILYGAPSQFIAMMEHSAYGDADLSRLRGGIMGGAPCPMEVMKKVVEQMGVSDILVGYGQTEASSWVTLTRPDDPLEVRVSTIGRALEMTEVKIVDPVSGEEAASGQAGEMCTRGFLMEGYYSMPAATAQAIDGQGWLHTGDMVMLDESGNGRVLGRIKDLILKNGGEISPVDIEEALFGHPEILEAAAFGLPGRDGNELAAVWVKIKPGSLLTPEEVISYCRGRLPDWSVPDFVHFTEYFPMTATGKIQKYKMKEVTKGLLEGAN